MRFFKSFGVYELGLNYQVVDVFAVVKSTSPIYPRGYLASFNDEKETGVTI